MRELIERLEKAEGPDRELDADIYEAIGFEVRRNVGRREWSYRYHLEGQRWPAMEWLTSSLDAAVALVERVLPGWTIAHIGQNDRKQWHAELRKGYQTSYSRVSIKQSPLPAIALILAALKAKEAGE